MPKHWGVAISTPFPCSGEKLLGQLETNQWGGDAKSGSQMSTIKPEVNVLRIVLKPSTG